MNQEYTVAQLAQQITALETMFDRVSLIDPAAATQLDPTTLQPVGNVPAVPSLDVNGRAWQPMRTGQGTDMVFYQAVCVAGRPCVLAAAYDLPRTLPANSREANAFLRMLSQYADELRHDYVTGAYNRRYLEEEYRHHAWRRATADEPVCVVLVRVNEYGWVFSQEGQNAADCCLNTAAGILQLAISQCQADLTLVRLEDGTFLVGGIGVGRAQLEATLREAMEAAHKGFSLSLSRRSTFTAALAGADWAETGNWDQMLSLATHRLANS